MTTLPPTHVRRRIPPPQDARTTSKSSDLAAVFMMIPSIPSGPQQDDPVAVLQRDAGDERPVVDAGVSLPETSYTPTS
jgi:hypothetical protein